MLRPSVSRRFLGLALAASVGTGIGLGAAAVRPGSAADAQTAPVPASTTTAATPATPATPATTATPAPAGGSASSPLTLDQATAIALQASPGTVTEVDQDVEPTGPVFDVTIQHPDGTETKVQVDANTGQVLSTETEGQDG